MPRAIGPNKVSVLCKEQQEIVDYLVGVINSSIREEEKDPIGDSKKIHIFFIESTVKMLDRQIMKAVSSLFLQEGWQKADWLPDSTLKLTRL